MLTALKKKKRFCLSLKNGDQPFFVLAATLKNLGAKWLSEKKKIHTLLILLPILHSTLLGVCHSPVGRVRLRHRR